MTFITESKPAHSGSETESKRKVTCFQMIGRVVVVSLLLWAMLVSLRGFRALTRQVPTSEQMIEEVNPGLTGATRNLVTWLEEGGGWEFSTKFARIETEITSHDNARAALELPIESIEVEPSSDVAPNSDWRDLSRNLLQLARSTPHDESLRSDVSILTSRDDLIPWRVVFANEFVLSASIVSRLDGERSLLFSVMMRDPSGEQPDEAVSLETRLLPESVTGRCVARRVDRSGRTVCELIESVESSDRLFASWSEADTEFDRSRRNPRATVESWYSRAGQSRYVWSRHDPNQNVWTHLIVNLHSDSESVEDLE